MEDDLLINLINSGVIRKGTEVEILRAGLDIGGHMSVYSPHAIEIHSYKMSKHNAMLIGCSILDGKRFKIKAEHIRSIDGMDPARLKTAFQSEGKKRGRKPNPK